MELIEKFKKALIKNAKTEVKDNGVDLMRWYQKDAESCVTIADEHAIKFAEWKDTNCNKSIYLGKFWMKYDKKKKDLTYSELLEIFKNQPTN